MSYEYEHIDWIYPEYHIEYYNPYVEPPAEPYNPYQYSITWKWWYNCPKCNNVVEIGDVYCKHCGHQLIVKKTCPHCGKEIE